MKGGRQRSNSLGNSSNHRHSKPHLRKVFVCDDKFADIKAGLLKRGWAPNPVLGSPSYDFKWRNYRNINFRLLRQSQVINHLYNAPHLSSKALLACHLQGPNRLVDRSFFPRSWLPFRDSHLGNLLYHLALTRAYSRVACAGRTTPYRRRPIRDWPPLEDCLACCEQYLQYLEDRRPGGDGAAFCLPRTLMRRLLRDGGDEDGADIRDDQEQDGLVDRVEALLARLRGKDRQLAVYEDEGAWPDGVWIVKPCGGSCGRDIKVVASLPRLLEELGSRGFDCVVQKYIDKPLLLQGRKFDIRLWILVTSVNPLVVWEFSDCYLRLSTKPFVPAALDDPYVHLCNYAVQKNHPDYPRDPMWHSSRFRAHLQDQFGGDPYLTRLRPAIRKLVIDTLTSTQDILERRARGFEWLGLDVMVDESLVPWLIEVNVSPDVSHSTPVTKELVQTATADLLSMLYDEGSRDGDLGSITSVEDLPSRRVSPELRRWRQIKAPVNRGGDGDATKEDDDGAAADQSPPCWRVWHVGDLVSVADLEGRAKKKGSADWEVQIRKEKADAGLTWGKTGQVVKVEDLLVHVLGEQGDDKDEKEGVSEGVMGAGEVAEERGEEEEEEEAAQEHDCKVVEQEEEKDS